MNDNQNDEATPPSRFLIWAAVFEGGTAILALGLGWLLSAPPFAMIQWTAAGAWWGIVASLPLLGLVIGSVYFSIGPLARLTETVERLLVPMFKPANVIDLAVISILAGLGEELLFRGVAQHQIAVAIGGTAGPWAGLILASMLFGLMHWVTFGYAVLATAIGVYLGWLWMATGNLLTPVVTHALYDWVILVYLVKVRGGRN